MQALFGDQGWAGLDGTGQTPRQRTFLGEKQVLVLVEAGSTRGVYPCPPIRSRAPRGPWAAFGVDTFRTLSSGAHDSRSVDLAKSLAWTGRRRKKEEEEKEEDEEDQGTACTQH